MLLQDSETRRITMGKLSAIITMLCLCIGTAWAQNNKSINTVYEMDVIVAATNISPQTTSMLILVTGYFPGTFIRTFDGAVVVPTLNLHI
jgi:hypothetical protein